MLHIKLLGEMELRTEQGGRISGISDKSMALLALLFLAENHQCRRNMLMDFLWPDSSEDAAKYNLRYNLWALKKAIPADEAGESLLVVTRDYCGINERYDYICDFCRVRDIHAEEIESPEELEECLKLLSGDLFGDCYLDGCSAFQEQIILWRFALENKKLTVLRKLIRVYYQMKNKPRCLELLEFCEEMDPYDEEHARMRLAIYMEDGNMEAAARYYQRFTKQLAIDIGAKPSAELKLLAEQICVPRKKPQEVLELYTTALEHVELYWLSDILRVLLEMEGFSVEDYLDEVQIRDLAAIQYRLGECTGPVHVTRIADAFMNLVGGICSTGQSLHIRLEKNRRPDPVSMDILRLLQEKYRKTLEITIKQM